LRLGIVGVANASMLPTYRHGDCLLVLYGVRRIRVGDVVLVRRPELLLVKRVAEVAADGSVTVLSDNALVGTDSRAFGPVPSEDVVARVLLRYWRRQRG
jgi:phage repressor protein C with HTH and peptisase S24 domain